MHNISNTSMASSITKIKASSKLHLRAHPKIQLSDAASGIFAAALIGLILLAGHRESNVSSSHEEEGYYMELSSGSSMKGGQFRRKGCDEIYVVGEGETVHTISDKCGDPFIVVRNPHIHDPDDVFPGLVIRVVSSCFQNLERCSGSNS